MRLRKGIYYHYVHHMRYSIMYVIKHHETLKIIFDYLERGGANSLFHAHMVPILSIECTSKTQTIHITSYLKVPWLLLKAREWN